MGTIADKLAKLAATKADLKAALAEKGQTVGDVFSTYPAAVRSIETGGKTATLTIDASFPESSTAVYIQTPDSCLKISPISIGQTYTIVVPSIAIVHYDRSSPSTTFPGFSGNAIQKYYESYELGLGAYFDVIAYYLTGDCNLIIDR